MVEQDYFDDWEWLWEWLCEEVLRIADRDGKVG